MKKTATLLFSFFSAIVISNAQSVDCSSPRFDTEVFSSFDTTLDVVYGANADYNGTNTVLTLDVYQPQGDTMAQRPLIVWAHGGSFLSGTKNDLDVQRLCENFTKRGYVCASINYRLGVSFPFNQANATKAVYRAVQDMKAAIRFFRKDAATTNTFQIDPNIIYAGGSSAGALTVLHMAYMNEYTELPTSIDTSALGDLEGNTGNSGYSSEVNAVVDLCGALGDKTWIKPGDIPFVAMHGTLDAVVPYGTDVINLLGFPIMQVDGSYSICGYADTIGVYNQFYTYFGGDHVPYYSNLTYMDTTVRFVSNFLFAQLGCTPSDLNPLPNTFNLNTVVNEIEQSFTIYPNPSTESFIISIKNGNERIESIKVFDVLGKTILEKTILDSRFTLDGSLLKSGTYFLKMKIGDHEEVKMLVKQ